MILAGLTIGVHAAVLPSGIPLVFAAQGEGPDSVTAFTVRGHDYQFLIEPTGARMVLSKPEPRDSNMPRSRYDFAKPRTVSTRSMQMHFVDGRSDATLSGSGMLPGKINYLIGSDPAQWRRGIAAYSQVRADNIYPGVSVLYYGNQKNLEYDFTVAPGAAVGQIQMQFDGVDELRINDSGELVLKVGQEEVHQHRPDIYQIVSGTRRAVRGGYQLMGHHTAGFVVESYDKTLPLIIDPVLSYATYFGGNSTDGAFSVKLDDEGSIYIAGETLSTAFTFPLAPGFDHTFGGGKINGDGFVAKFDNAGRNLIYFTYLGGSSDDGVLDMAVNQTTHNAFLTGFTQSPNFPTTANALYPHISGTNNPLFNAIPPDAFVTELTTNGNDLVYSTYIGGSDSEVAGGIAIDPSDNAYITGYTYSTDFPCTNSDHPPFQGQIRGSNDVFVAKIAAGGTALLYSTYFGGTNLDTGEGIAVDASQIAYVTGYTCSTNFFTSTNPMALQPQINHAVSNATIELKNKAVHRDAFLLVFDTLANSGPASLRYSTFLGGTNDDSGSRIRLDSSGDVYITGNTLSVDFPNTNSVGLRLGNRGTNAANFDAFLTKYTGLTSAAPSIVYSVRFGGDFNDAGWDVAVDPAGNAYVVGITGSTNFPTTNVPFNMSPTNSGGNDVFVTAINSNATACLYSGLLGGRSNDFGYGIAVDANRHAYIIGETSSINFLPPALNAGAFDASRNSTNDAFLAIILPDPAPMLTVTSSTSGLRLTWPDYWGLTLQQSSNLINWSTIPGPYSISNGQFNVSVPFTNPAAMFRLKK
jgi:hypothetical protein